MTAIRNPQCLARAACRSVALLTALLFSAVLLAADRLPPEFPSKPMRIIVAASGGTSDDFFARVVAQELSAFYRKRIVVDNRTGAGGLIGNMVVSRAPADGHTLALIGVTRIVNVLMHDEPPYRALADITGVAHVASIANVLTVTPAIPVRTAPEFVDYARRRVGELNYASLGIGSASHLAGEVFSRASGIKSVHIPFRRLSDSYVEMVLGRVHFAVMTVPSVSLALLERRIRALAVMTPYRVKALPDVPSIAEFGLPEAQFDSWSGIVVPAGTPRRIVEQLHGDIARVLRKPSLHELFEFHGAVPMPENTPDGFSRLMQSEYLRFQELLSKESISRI